MTEFGIEKKKCYFCGNERLIKFHEHYYFCPECSCIYTYSIIMESHCKHIKENYRTRVKVHIPTVIRKSWYKEVRTNKIYVKEGEPQTCSKCGANCIADGW